MPTGSEDICEGVVRLVSCLCGRDDVAPDTGLMQRGFLDSLNLVRLVMELENSFGVRIPRESVTAANFASGRTIANLIEYLLNRGAAQ
ncbi:MAG: acyl carrier protein [Rhizomicrobium sp.]